MCLILFAYQVDARYPLVVASNRDEFYDRPTAQAHFWSPKREEDANDKGPRLILAGKDLEAGGTWLGVSGGGAFRFAAVTNYREAPRDIGPNRRSRGELVSDFLVSDIAAVDYLKGIKERASCYDGFNLVVGDSPSGLWYLSNREENGPRKLDPGRIYGLCNRLIDDPWPKVLKSKHAMSEVMKDIHQYTEEEAQEHLFHVLRDTTKPPSDEIPRSEETGHSQENEKLFSSIFIESDWYGTRASTVLLVPAAEGENKAVFSERSFTLHGKALGEVNEKFEIK